MAKTSKPSILDLLAEVSEADLEIIDEKITALTTDIANIQAEIDSLRVVRKTVDVKLHGKPERKKPVRKAKAGATAADKPQGDDDADRNRIYDWLANQGGPCKPGVIDAALGIHHLRVNSLCKHAWFDESIAGFSIA